MKYTKRVVAFLLSMLLFSGCINYNAFVIAEDNEVLSSDLVVETTYGKMSGVEHTGDYEGITEFRGIPYAAAPEGDLRFAPPEDPESWDGIYEATEYANIVYQYAGDTANEPWKTDFYPDGTPEQSEDGLYLNVITSYTGEDDDLADRPVFIWFHGGGLNHGYSYEPEFNGEELAKKGVVVVTVGHRLNVFGYLALEQLTEEQGSSGNYGLMDQFKALDWVWDNIEAFGGTRDNITVGGQSGGASKTMAMAISPKNDGRIKNIIMQSGFPYTTAYTSLESAYTRWSDILTSMGVDPDSTVEELRAMDPEVFIQQSSGFTVQDGEYITYSSVAEAIEDGALDGINVLVGSNLGEAGYQTSSTADEFYAKHKSLIGDELYNKYDFENLVEVTDDNANDTARMLASYGLTTTYSRNLMMGRLFGNYLTEISGGESSVYVYLFSHFTPALESDYGTSRDPNTLWAWHSSELWYMFASLRDGVPAARPWEDYDYELADIMSSYWANFMKTGNPNGDGLEYWPQADSSLGYIDLGDEISTYTGLETDLDYLMAEFVSSNLGFDIPESKADYTIIGSSNEGGTVSASTEAFAGKTAEITIKANEGYKLVAILVDGKTVDISDMQDDTYMIENVQDDMMVHALFVKDQEDFAAKFTDVINTDGGTWYYDAVNMLTGLGIIDGKTETSFEPEENITRSEFTKLLYTLAATLGIDVEQVNSVPFTDIQYNNYWATGYIGWAYENEVVMGYDSQRFGPEDNITRQDMAVMMERFFKDYLAYELPGDTVTNFTDADQISDYASEAVAYTVEKGLMQGYVDGSFAPVDNTLRQEAAQVLYNYLIYTK